jgi:hypothetical protein
VLTVHVESEQTRWIGFGDFQPEFLGSFVAFLCGIPSMTKFRNLRGIQRRQIVPRNGIVAFSRPLAAIVPLPTHLESLQGHTGTAAPLLFERPNCHPLRQAGRVSKPVRSPVARTHLERRLEYISVVPLLKYIGTCLINSVLVNMNSAERARNPVRGSVTQHWPHRLQSSLSPQYLRPNRCSVIWSSGPWHLHDSSFSEFSAHYHARPALTLTHCPALTN